MIKISKAFENKKAFIAYLMGGDPCLSKTGEYILAMQDAGADLVEIGIPFSDPIAEGEVIQRANLRALNQGVTLDGIFDMLMEIKSKITIPLVFLTYLNPVLYYGPGAFFKRCRDSGVSGIIVPDMPFEEQGELAAYAEKFGVEIITLVAPTSHERIDKIASSAKGFIYLVSSMGTTGVRSKITTDITKIVSRIRKASDIPVAVGFGIATRQQAAECAGASDGAIVGSAIVKIIEEYGDNAAKPLYDYVKDMKAGVGC